jgi:hypothetical protein
MRGLCLSVLFGAALGCGAGGENVSVKPAPTPEPPRVEAPEPRPAGTPVAAVPPERPKVVTVKGKVTYNGKALDGGHVQFMGADNLRMAADIAKDGTYSIVAVPTGTVKVAVSYVDAKAGDFFKALSAASRGGDASALPKGDPEQFHRVPQKFWDFPTSGLTAEIKPGVNTLDIHLKD